MKKLLLILIAIFASALFSIDVLAASFGASASTSTVNPGGTFTISVGGDSIGRVDLTVSNGTLSTTSVWVEQNYQTVTVTAGSSGTVTVTATPAVGFSDADANIYNPGARTVSVAVKTPGTTTTQPETSIPTQKKSSNNLLSSLEINVGTISPAFNKNIVEYTVNLKNDVTSLKITAKQEDSKARVSGTGDISLKPGLNNLSITVTAENGSKKTYTIKVYVNETPKTYLSYRNSKIGIVRNLDGIELDGFEKEEYALDDEKTAIFKNGSLTLIYGIDSEDKKSFYIFDKETNSIINRLTPIEISNRTFYVIDDHGDDVVTTVITIAGKELEVQRTEDEDYYLIKTVDDENRHQDYIIDLAEESIIRYSNVLFSDKSCTSKSMTLDKVIIKLESTFLLLFIVLSLYLYKKNRQDR